MENLLGSRLLQTKKYFSDKFVSIFKYRCFWVVLTILQRKQLFDNFVFLIITPSFTAWLNGSRQDISPFQGA